MFELVKIVSVHGVKFIQKMYIQIPKRFERFEDEG